MTDVAPAEPLTAATLVEPARLADPRAKSVWRIENTLWAVVVLGGLSAANYFWWPQAAWGWWVIGALAVVHLADIVLDPSIRYPRHRWDVSADAVYTRTGWMNVEHRIAPMSRVQTVDVDRGPLQQLFGLATVTVTTASSAGPVNVGPIALDAARALVRDLTAAAGTQDAT